MTSRRSGTSQAGGFEFTVCRSFSEWFPCYETSTVSRTLASVCSAEPTRFTARNGYGSHVPVQYLNGSRCSASVPSGGRTKTMSRSRSCVLGPTQMTSTSSGRSISPSRSKILCASCRSFRTVDRTSGSVIVLRRNATAASLRSCLDFHVLGILFTSLIFVFTLGQSAGVCRPKLGHMCGEFGEKLLELGHRCDLVETRIKAD